MYASIPLATASLLQAAGTLKIPNGKHRDPKGGRLGKDGDLKKWIGNPKRESYGRIRILKGKHRTIRKRKERTDRDSKKER